MRHLDASNQAAALFHQAVKATIIIAIALFCDAAIAEVTNEAAPDQVAAGRAIYRGHTPLRQPPSLHGVPLASPPSCAGCHGPRGAARTEAGVHVPAIQWSQLMQRTTARPAYVDSAAVRRALTEGLASDGRALSAPMPRLTLTDDEARNLLAYLSVLGTDADMPPGVTPTRVVLGSVLPASRPGLLIRAALTQGVARVNASGGIFGRQLALEIAEAGPTAASAEQAAVELVRSGRVFALVGSLLPVAGEALRGALTTHDTAMVATLGVPPTDQVDPLLSWLLPSLARQTRELAAELMRACPSAAPAADLGRRPAAVRVLHLPGIAVPPASSAEATEPILFWQPVADAAAVHTALRQGGPLALPTIALLPASLTDFVRGELASGEYAGCLGTLAALSGEAAPRAGLRELIALPMPRVPLPATGNQGSDAVLWPLLADSALAITVEALSRAGRQLDTAALQSALNSLHRFEPRPGLAVDFNARRRHGFDVSYLWKEGPDEPRSPKAPGAPRFVRR